MNGILLKYTKTLKYKKKYCKLEFGFNYQVQDFKGL